MPLKLMSTSTFVTTFDEAELVRRAKAGDPDAFLTLVGHFDRRVYRIAKQITQSDRETESVLIDTFVKACSDLADCPDETKVSAWIVKIAVSEALRRARTDGPTQAPSTDPAGSYAVVIGDLSGWRDNAEADYSRQELARILDQAMQTLEPLNRAILVLRDIEELSTEDAAQALNLSIPAYHFQLLRARLQVRNELTHRFKKDV